MINHVDLSSRAKKNQYFPGPKRLCLPCVNPHWRDQRTQVMAGYNQTHPLPFQARSLPNRARREGKTCRRGAQRETWDRRETRVPKPLSDLTDEAPVFVSWKDAEYGAELLRHAQILDMDPRPSELPSYPRRAQTNETWQEPERRQLLGRYLFHSLRIVAKDMQASGSGIADRCRSKPPDDPLMIGGMGCGKFTCSAMN